MRSLTDRTPEFTTPAGALPCIWMSAGLVAYKLCDRGFECDGCPFDQAMRGALPPRPGRGEPPSAEASLGEFPGDRGYHPGHAWAAGRPDGAVRVGIDAVFAALAGRPGAVVLAAPGSVLERGRAASWWVAGGELIPVPSPVDGTVLRRNDRLSGDPGLAASDPYGEGWLLEVETPGGGGSGAALLDAAEARRRAAAQREAFLEEAAALLEAGRAEVGPTLPDGGRRLSGLKEMLGPGRYHRLAARHLAGEPRPDGVGRAGVGRPGSSGGAPRRRRS
jgi:glycine cleavage system H protein